MSGTHRPTRTAGHLGLAVVVTLLPGLLTVLVAAPASAAGLVTTVPPPATVTTQFSDPLAMSFSATSDSGVLTATATPLPAGLALVRSGTDTAASWSVTGTTTAAPGSSVVHVEITDQTTTDPFDVTVVVDPEQASVAYTGPANVVATNANADDEAPVTITAQVTQADDGQPGAIDRATVTFTDTLTGEDLCLDAPVAGSGTASCTFVADLFGEDVLTYHVALTVGGAYAGASATDAVLTVSLPPDPTDADDYDGPETTLSGPSSWLLGTTGAFGFASSIPKSTFVCRLDADRVPCAGPSLTLAGLSPGTHRLTVAAEDQDGWRDATPAVRDFAVPVDDAGLASKGAWRRKKSATAYLGTFSQARKAGVSLTYRVKGARELALLVRTGKRYGAVQVFLGDTLLGTVKTAGKPGSRMIKLAHYPGPRSGLLRIVTTSGRTVRIDGLGVSTAPF